MQNYDFITGYNLFSNYSSNRIENFKQNFEPIPLIENVYGYFFLSALGQFGKVNA